MMVIEVTKSFSYSEQDVKDILCSCFEGGCNWWATICNDTDEWDSVSDECQKKKPDYVIEDVMYNLLMFLKGFDLYDAEDDETYNLTLEKFENGIYLAIHYGDWDGNIDTLDGEIGDAIIQYALFGEIIFG